MKPRVQGSTQIAALVTPDDFVDAKNEDGDNTVLVKCHELSSYGDTNLTFLSRLQSVDLRLEKVLSVHLSNSDTTTAERLYWRVYVASSDNWSQLHYVDRLM